MNKVILYGNLGGDVELRTTGSGKAVANFTLATSNGKDRDPDWHKIVVWEQGAEIANDRGYTGVRALVEGRLTYRTWEDKDGQKRTVAEVIAFRVEWPTKTPEREQPESRTEPESGYSGARTSSSEPVGDDDDPGPSW